MEERSSKAFPFQLQGLSIFSTFPKRMSHSHATPGEAEKQRFECVLSDLLYIAQPASSTQSFPRFLLIRALRFKRKRELTRVQQIAMDEISKLHHRRGCKPCKQKREERMRQRPNTGHRKKRQTYDLKAASNASSRV